ncbi:hypothetical protein RB195_010720 [Necator americanus]|uniref:Uncharacterized protein n=1 Tax=Necator americanus TaxID=51031 RepID=A0ABR1CZ80_NECAM
METTHQSTGNILSFTSTTSTTQRYDDVHFKEYTHFLLVLVSFILSLAAVMCAARIIFVYCTYKRRREETEARRHPTTTMGTETVREPERMGIENYGFSDPPPRYDQVYKEDEAPPLYESLCDFVRHNDRTLEREENAEHGIRSNNEHFRGGGNRARMMEETPAHCAIASNPNGIWSVSRPVINAGVSAPTSESNTGREVCIADSSQEIQNQLRSEIRISASSFPAAFNVQNLPVAAQAFILLSIGAVVAYELASLDGIFSYS